MENNDEKKHFFNVYQSHIDSIFRFCLIKTSDRNVAQDIAQEVFARYWQGMRERLSIENDRAYLYTIARNLITDWYRKKKSTSLDMLQEAGVEFASDDHQAIERGAEAQEALRVIQQLDETSQEVLTLRFVEGLPPSEIARIIGEPVNRVSVRINRAIHKVHQLLNQKPHHE